MTTKEVDEKYAGQFFDFADMTYAEYALMKQAKRSKVFNLSPTDANFECKPGELSTEVCKLSFKEELTAVMVLLFGIPGAVFSIPALILLIGILTSNLTITIMIACCFLFPLHLYPVFFSEDALYSWLSFLMLRYFSFRCVVHGDADLKSNKLYILVAPPHGVMPFGNVITMICFPFVTGFSFRGLAANSALKIPIFGHLLTLLGAIPASNSSACEALQKGESIGIPTGGISEIFEADNDENEVIVMKNRKGMIKLAYKFGAALVPCYLYGNTKSLSIWAGRKDSTLRGWLRQISRKIGVALIFFWGRFFLPVPYRHPLFGALGKPIPVPKKSNPSEKEIDDMHALLMAEEVKLFDEYKKAYGWQHKKLIIV